MWFACVKKQVQRICNHWINCLVRPCALCLQPDCCYAVCVMDCACAHTEDNITCLTLPFFFFLVLHRRVHTRSTQTHTLPFLGGHVFRTACHYSCLDVVTGWHWGFLLLSFYDNFHSLALSCLPPFFPFPSLLLSFVCALVLCTLSVSLPTFHSISQSPLCPNPHPSFFPLQRDGCCLFAVCKPSCHISWAKAGFRRVFVEAGRTQ